MEVQRFTPYLGIAILILLAVFAAAFSGRVSDLRSPTTSTSSATLLVPPASTRSSLALPSVKPKTESATPQAPTPIQPTAPAKRATSPAPSSAPVISSNSNTALDSSAADLRSALVNIICYAPLNSALHSISGSGVFISPKGIILTNSHIAQYFLLADRGVSCIIRTGGPATARYTASLLYISPAWLNANASVLTQTAPSGTGQYDFALLAVSASATSLGLPTSFPYVPLAIDPPSIGTPVTIASYAAQSLGFSQIESNLFPTVVLGSVKDVFTFEVNSVDVLSLGGSAAAQQGSSGGGVVNSQGELVGTLTTSTISGATSSRTLDAITATYIRAEYLSETGQTLDSLLAKSPTIAAANFALQIPTLEAIITAHL